MRRGGFGDAGVEGTGLRDFLGSCVGYVSREGGGCERIRFGWSVGARIGVWNIMKRGELGKTRWKMRVMRGICRQIQAFFVG